MIRLIQRGIKEPLSGLTEVRLEALQLVE